MPIDVTVRNGPAAKTRRVCRSLSDMAQDDLFNAISCIEASVDSDRQELLLATAEEFMKCAVGKLRLAATQSRLGRLK